MQVDYESHNWRGLIDETTFLPKGKFSGVNWLGWLESWTLVDAFNSILLLLDWDLEKKIGSLSLRPRRLFHVSRSCE